MESKDTLLSSETDVAQSIYMRVCRVAGVAIAILWAVFQLLLPRVVLFSNITVRLIHLSFAISLALIVALETQKHTTVVRRRLTTYLRLIILLMSIAAIGYLLIDRVGIASRAGRPIQRDIIFGALLIVAVIYSTRLNIGIWLPIIAILFSGAVFFGEYLPRIISFRGGSLAKYTNQVVLSTEGIFGIPLDVSANTVYLFVLLGSLLGKTGASVFFNDVAAALFGRFRGGPAKTAVVASGLTGLVSGSSIANVVTTGTFTIPLMKKVGYPPQVAAATEVAASTNGQLMPPIMGAAAFIIAEYLGIGYIDVIKAAAIPAFVSYIALFYITHLEALRYNLRGLPRDSIPLFWNALKSGAHHLIPIGILVVDLVLLRRSPKFAAFDAIIALSLVHFVRAVFGARRSKQPILPSLRASGRDLLRGCVDGSKNMLPVALATATAGIVVGTVNMGIGSLVVQVVEIISAGNIFLLLGITAIASLVLGMGLPTTATYIVMASITVPIIVQIGGGIGLIIPAIAAHLFCFYFGILADDTPPVGLAAYAAAAIAECSPVQTGIKGFVYDLRTAVIPFMFVFNSELLLQGIDSFWHGMLIFSAATVGSLAFASAVQGWGVVRNKWFEIPFFLLATLFLFLPTRSLAFFNTLFSAEIPFGARYAFYALGAVVFACVLGEQYWRRGRTAHS